MRSSAGSLVASARSLRAMCKPGPTDSPMPATEQAAFRATFPLQLDPQYREALERTGWLLENLFRNLESDAESAGDLDAQMGAVATDLRHLAGVLSWIGRHQTASELSPAETPIAQRAATLAS